MRIYIGRNPYELSYEIAVMWGKREVKEHFESAWDHGISISFYAETLRYVGRILAQVIKVRTR